MFLDASGSVGMSDDDDKDAVPEHIPVVSRTASDDLTRPMFMIDHRLARIDGPPDFADEDDTDVDAIVVDVSEARCRVPGSG